MTMYEGHVQGMLDRDQRTAKLRICDASDLTSCLSTASSHLRSLQQPPQIDNSQLNKQQSIKKHHRQCVVVSHKIPRRLIRSLQHYFPTQCSWTRLKHLLILGVYLSVITGTTAAPVPKMDKVPKWHNPCGGSLSSDQTDDAGPMTIATGEVLQSLNAVVNQAKVALHQATNTLTVLTERLDVSLMPTSVDWLPQPKEKGEKVSEEHLASLELKDILPKIYSDLQTVAVGLEQAIWDDEKARKIPSVFVHTMNQLALVLCELNYVMVDAKVSKNPDVSRDAMPNDWRTANNSAGFRETRDIMVLNAYINILEYTQDVVSHLARQYSN